MLELNATIKGTAISKITNEFVNKETGVRTPQRIVNFLQDGMFDPIKIKVDSQDKYDKIELHKPIALNCTVKEYLYNGKTGVTVSTQKEQ